MCVFVFCRDISDFGGEFTTANLFVKSTRSPRGSQLGVGLTGVYNSGPKTAGGPQRKNSNLTIYRAI